MDVSLSVPRRPSLGPCMQEEAKMSELNKLKLEEQGNARTLRAKEEELRQVHVSAKKPFACSAACSFGRLFR